MNNSITRRRFLKQSSILTAGLASWAGTASLRAAKGANEKILLGIIGCNGRGMAHIAGYLSVPNTEIAYICDVDSRAIAKGIAAAAKKQMTIVNNANLSIGVFISALPSMESSAQLPKLPDALALACNKTRKHCYR